MKAETTTFSSGRCGESATPAAALSMSASVLDISISGFSFDAIAGESGTGKAGLALASFISIPFHIGFSKPISVTATEPPGHS
jgi:hypothetical protein